MEGDTNKTNKFSLCARTKNIKNFCVQTHDIYIYIYIYIYVFLRVDILYVEGGTLKTIQFCVY